MKRRAMVVVVALACSGDARQGLTADSAVLQHRDTPAVVIPDTGTPVDSTSGDTTQVDSATLAGPTFVLLADSAEGDVLFRRKGKCLTCHGLSGKGLEGLGANLQDSLWLHGDGSMPFIRQTIMEGIARPKISPTVMPAFATTLTPDEIFRIAAYVYTLSHPGSAVADTTRIPIDTIPRIDTIPPSDTVPPIDTIPPNSAVLPPS